MTSSLDRLHALHHVVFGVLLRYWSARAADDVPAYPAMTPLRVLGIFLLEAEELQKTNGSLTFRTRRLRVTVSGFLQNSFICSS
jgi:hypothetical protein